MVNADSKGPWVPAGGPVTAVTLTNSGTGFTAAPSVAFNVPTGANGSGAAATALMGVGTAAVTASGQGSYSAFQTPALPSPHHRARSRLRPAFALLVLR